MTVRFQKKDLVLFRSAFFRSASAGLLIGAVSLSNSFALAQATAANCTYETTGHGPAGTAQVQMSAVVQNRSVPWEMVFLPSGEILATERSGTLFRTTLSGVVTKVEVTLPVHASGEGGLMGVVLHPSFAQNNQFYVFYTTKKNDKVINRVDLLKMNSAQTSAQVVKTVVDDIPGGGVHNGGRLRFGPDQKLYIGTGDARSANLAQDPQSLAGKILRINDDGTVPEDNPISGNRLWVLGVRNPQGMDWLNDTTMIIGDHGPTGDTGRSGHDEVSLAKKGENLGWPTIYSCEAKEGMVSPLITWKKANPPGSLVFYRGDAIPDWKGKIVMTNLGSKHVQVISLNETQTKVSNSQIYFTELGRLRPILVNSEGEIFISTSNRDGRGAPKPGDDQILKLKQ